MPNGMVPLRSISVPMRTAILLPFIATLILLVAGCRHCPDPKPCPPATAPEACSCCGTIVGKPGATGAQARGPNEPLDVTTTDIGDVDLAVDTPETHVDVLTGLRRFHVRFKNNGDDSARCARAIILLPTESMVTRVDAPRNGKQLPWSQCTAFIEVQLGGMGVHATQVVEVDVADSRVRAAQCPPAFGAMIFSPLADIDPSNNYWWWMSRCCGGSDDYSPEPGTWGPRCPFVDPCATR